MPVLTPDLHPSQRSRTTAEGQGETTFGAESLRSNLPAFNSQILSLLFSPLAVKPKKPQIDQFLEQCLKTGSSVGRALRWQGHLGAGTKMLKTLNTKLFNIER